MFQRLLNLGWLVLLAAVVFFAHYNYRQRKTIYFYTGFFCPEETREGISFYSKNLSRLCSEKGFRLKMTRSLDGLKDLYRLVVFDLEGISRKCLRQYPPKRLILFLWEPPSTVPKNYQTKYHRYFSRIYTWNDSLVDNRKYFQFYYPEKRLSPVTAKPFGNKKLLAMVARCKSSQHLNELYSHREREIEFFEKTEDFSLFGMGWDKKQYRNYRGAIDTKEVLRDFRFCLCYENIHKIHGYVTEKIFDAFYFRTVPVYLGADNITDYIPENCFIDRRKFSSLEALYAYLKNMPEKEHQAYLENIERFLNSPESDRFSPERFFSIFQKALFEN
ncbi:MAG: glycosyltransferase family 10 [Parachlamydiales bacterium]|jgi:hypothetical protein